MVDLSIGGIVYRVPEEHARIIVLIVERKALEAKNACISMNFDKDGVMQTIERKDFLYSMRHDG